MPENSEPKTPNEMSKDELAGVIESMGQEAHEPSPLEVTDIEPEPDLEAEQSEEVVEEQEAEAAEVEPEEEGGEEAVEPTKDFDLGELENRLRQSEEQAFRAKMEAHNSRLAGQIGYLKDQLKRAQPEGRDPYGDDAPSEVSQLRAELAELRAERQAGGNSQAVAAAIQHETAQFISEWDDSDDFQAEMAAVIPKYAERFNRSMQAGSDEEARANAREVLAYVQRDAMRLKISSAKKAAAERNKANSKAMRNKKKVSASASSASRANTAPRKSPKTPATATKEELAEAIHRMQRDGAFDR